MPVVLPILLLAACVFLVLFGMGVALVLIVAAVTAILIAAGVVSTAAFIGVATRRFSAGVQAFTYLIFTILGLFAGTGVAFCCNLFLDLPIPVSLACFIGADVGLIAGLALAFVHNKVLFTLVAWFGRRAGRSFPVEPASQKSIAEAARV